MSELRLNLAVAVGPYAKKGINISKDPRSDITSTKTREGSETAC